MDSLLKVDWTNLFTMTMSPLELIVRGTLVYLFVFCLFRFILHRDVGSVGIADLLVLVIIADASQNAMGDYDSIADGFVLVSTIAFWNYFFDYMSYHFNWFARFSQPPPLLIVKDGVKQRKNMRREMMTDEELMEMLRNQGVESLDEVKAAHLEADGHLSILRRRPPDWMQEK